MTLDEAIAGAKQCAKEKQTPCYVILRNDGSYVVRWGKPLLSNVNGTREVIEVTPEGRTYLA